MFTRVRYLAAGHDDSSLAFKSFEISDVRDRQSFERSQAFLQEYDKMIARGEHTNVAGRDFAVTG